MNRIEQTFKTLKSENRKALVTFIMAGDPDAQKAQQFFQTLPENGADIIEIGMPFTDPMADGPAIQAAGLRALEAGATMHTTLDMVQQFRQTNDTIPIVLMGYLNPVLAYGEDQFAKDCARYGVDGVILVDLPPEESDEITPALNAHNIHLIRLITPTTNEDRLPAILKNAGGFLYYVSIAGVTGTKSANVDEVGAHIARVKTQTDLPVVVGFGIKTPDDAHAMSKIADGIVVGSAIVDEIGKGASPDKIAAQARALKSSMAQ